MLAMASAAIFAMASMGPEELKSMMDMAQQMQGAGGMEGFAAGGNPAAALNNPGMMRKMQDLVKLMAFLQYIYSLYAEARDFVRQRRSVQIALAILLLAFLLRWLGYNS